MRINHSLSQPIAAQQAEQLVGPSPAKHSTFQEIFKGLRDGPRGLGLDSFSEIAQVQQRILSGQKLTPQELIIYQVRAGEYNLRVELVSKIAESVMATMRKFQSSQ
ncbi:MAG: hypothetical protein J5J00_05040 [Deltaproteobacteria bacterium]|nr:hypothetical protein [Deltaproteobacteria bacterium]